MAVRRPQPDDLSAIARRFHFTIPPARMPVVQALVDGLLAPYDRLDELDEPKAPPRHPRDAACPGRQGIDGVRRPGRHFDPQDHLVGLPRACQ